jgi:hypothetical protein
MGQIDLDGSNSTVKADIIRGQASTTVKLGGLLDTDGNYIQTEKGGDLTSASPLVIDTDGDYFDVTGTVSFAAMTVAADRQFTLQFDGVLTMTHHATNLDLPGEANITTAAGDVATFQSTASNTVQCINYTRADGTAIVSSSHTPEGTAVLSTGEAGGTKYLREDGDNSSSWQVPDHDALTNFASNEHFTQANITATGTVASGTWNGTSIGTAYTDAKVTSVSGSTGAVSDGDIDHDSLGNFAANEHFTQANITATGTIASGTWQGTAVDGTYVDLEGTELKSTGEGGGAKYLREDGDNSCSWQAPASVGKHTLWIPAAAMRPTDSNGCDGITNVETTSGRPDLQVLDFDTSADEHAQFQIAMPKSWNESTITFRAFWTSTATDTDGVAWALQGVATANDDTIDVAYGTAVVVTDDNISAAEDCLVTAESSAVTIAGSPSTDELCWFRIFRDISDANDDMAEDARLIGIQMFVTTDAGEDT